MLTLQFESSKLIVWTFFKGCVERESDENYLLLHNSDLRQKKKGVYNFICAHCTSYPVTSEIVGCITKWKAEM